MKKKILVKGPAMSLSGYGEQCRFALRALRAYEDLFDIYIVNISWGQTGFIVEDTPERRWIDERLKETVEYAQNGGSYDISLQVTIPNEFEKIAPYNIGYTAGIETNKISPDWVKKCHEIDKLIVVSNHAKYGFDNTQYEAVDTRTGETIMVKSPAPVDVVNYAIRTFKPQELDLQLDTKFNFLTMAQWGPRKNLDNTINWFIEEFHDEEVGLVVKTFQKTNSHIDQVYTEEKFKVLLSKYPNRKCSIYFLHGSLSNEELAGLYSNDDIKAFVNLSHGEGFGLPMFEAAQHTLPVIAPAWSGHCDFLYGNVKNKKTKRIRKRPLFAKVDYTMGQVQPDAVWRSVIEPDSMWCYPTERGYKTMLRKVYSEYDKYLGMARKLKKHIDVTFTEENQFKQFAEAVLNTEIVTVNASDLPKVSIITSVYDGDDFIEPFLEDITSQTVFPNCELILVNPNSPGNEGPIIEKYMKKYDNIIYKTLDEDPGIYGTWNEALKLATGEYITNANLDDRKARHSIEEHAKHLYLNPEVGLVYADSYITNNANETYEENSSNNRRYNFEQFSQEAMLRGNQPHNNPMWRKELHDKHGLFNDKYRSAGDWEFFLRCAFAGETFLKINDVLGLYYFNPKGISTNFENFSWKQEEENEIYTKYHQIHQDKAATTDESAILQSISAENATAASKPRQTQGR